jgi:tRNA (guanine37-N1)-methyltransferase
MKFTILTLFPESFESYFNISIIKRALVKKFIKIKLVNFRDYATDNHKTVDSRPYGGGAGMVIRVGVIAKALKDLGLKIKDKNTRIVLLTPQGKPFNQKMAKTLARYKHVAIICGRYEGFDERIRGLVDIEVSLGDFVLTGGEIPAMAVLDATARLVPGVVGKSESLTEESFSEGLLEYPHYTRPEVFEGKKVPKVLLSGDHVKIKAWRKKESLKRTKKRRTDLLEKLD